MSQAKTKVDVIVCETAKLLKVPIPAKDKKVKYRYFLMPLSEDDGFRLLGLGESECLKSGKVLLDWNLLKGGINKKHNNKKKFKTEVKAMYHLLQQCKTALQAWDDGANTLLEKLKEYDNA